MIRARATTEHRSKGQIGQPAACMIENKVVPVEKSAAHRPLSARDYGPSLPGSRPWPNPKIGRFHKSTVAVDNFVGKLGAPGREGRQIKALNNLPQV